MILQNSGEWCRENAELCGLTLPWRGRVAQKALEQDLRPVPMIAGMSAADRQNIPHVEIPDSGRQFNYDGAQRGFHWTMAVFVIVAMMLGIYASFLPPGTSPRKELLDIHKSLGMTVLVLVPVRLAYRFIVGEPPYGVPLGRLMHLAARLGHFGLYGLMLAVPMSGYIYSAAGGYSLPWFGLFSWPRLLARNEALARSSEDVHFWVGRGLVALLCTHLTAVAWHVFARRDEVMGRMLLRQRRKQRG
jgi:cytochrome b561